MSFHKARYLGSAAGSETSVLRMAVGLFPMDGGASLEADFNMLDKDAPMLQGLVTQQSRGWEVNYQTGSVSIHGASLLPLRRRNRHFYVHLEPSDDSNGKSVYAYFTHANTAPAADSLTKTYAE